MEGGSYCNQAHMHADHAAFTVIRSLHPALPHLQVRGPAFENFSLYVCRYAISLPCDTAAELTQVLPTCIEGEWGARQGVRQETADKAGGGIAAMVAYEKEEWKDGGG